MAEETHLWRVIDAWMQRQRFGVSQAALARDVNVARTAVSQWKYGDARPTPANMRALQSATGIRYRDLLDAMLTDMGYLEVRDDRAASMSRDGASPSQEDYTLAARRGRIDPGEVGDQGTAGEESQDPGGDDPV